MTISNFLSFDKMITPTLISVLFYILLGVSFLSGISIIITGFASDFGGSFMVFYGFMVLLIGPLFARIYCELLIVLLKSIAASEILKEVYLEMISPKKAFHKN